MNRYLHYYIDVVNADGTVTESSSSAGSGRTFTHTWQNPGAYRLRMVYNSPNIGSTPTGTNYVFHKINIIDYTNSQKGKIEVRDFTSHERSLFGLPSTSTHKMARVADVYSSWKFKDGPRAIQDTGTGGLNRFAKFRDYADGYTWQGQPAVGTFSNIQNVHQVVNWLNNHNNLAWYPSNWVRHYNGGLPSNVDPNYFRSLSESGSYIDGLFTPAPAESWQQRFRWISTTAYQGPRIRTNIKVIYNMQKFFDNNTGAFSGTPVLPGPNDLVFWSPSDAQQDKELLYYDLLHGRAIVYDPSQHENLRVFNPDPASASTTTLIAEYQHQGGGAVFRVTNVEETAVEEPEESLSPLVQVYPNPASDWMVARVALPEPGEVWARLIDLKGNTIFEITKKLDKGWNTLNFDASNLPVGIYFLKINGSSIHQSERIIIK